MTTVNPTERGHVCVAECRPNAHVAFRGREEATASFLAAPDFEAARRDTHLAHERFAATLGINGSVADNELDVAFALHAIFPNLRFATSDIETDGAGGGVWLVPVPRTIGLLVEHGTDFAWSEVFDFEGPIATTVATISIESSL